MIVQFFIFTQGLPSFSECGRKRAGLSIYPFFVDWYKKISGCRHHVQAMSGDFLNIRTKSRSFCTNIRVNFLMFTSTFQLFFPSGCLFGSPCLRKAASES